VLFTPGTTFGINLVANGFTSILKPGDEVLISAMEHHSNIVLGRCFVKEQVRY
jgi:cysteine desulfurase/selenocysteine lyase